MSEVTGVSLLWPAGRSPEAEKTVLLGEYAGTDLRLNALVDRLDFRGPLRERMRALLLHPVFDPPVIRYRQDVLTDLLENPSLLAQLQNLLPRLTQLGYLVDYPYQTRLDQITTRLGELETYVECLHVLHSGLDDPQVTLRSEGLLRLRDLIHELTGDASFRELVEKLPGLRKQSSGVRSVTIGVNLDNQQHPYEATLVSINDQPYRGSGDNFLSRLFQNPEDRADLRGIAPLHVVPGTSPGLLGTPIPPSAKQRLSPLLVPLFQDLDRIIRRSIEPVERALREFVHVKSKVLLELEAEFAFYLGGAWLVQQMRSAGLPMCRAEIAAPEERSCHLEDFYNLDLAVRFADEAARAEAQAEAKADTRSASQKDGRLADLSQTVITNDVDFNETGRILILTGPNRGGKTTFVQALGQVQAFFQVGYYVPARQARISPVDALLTHFPLEEKPAADVGRLGEEAQRLNQIFQQASRHSLVLLNETLTTTSPGESIYLARDILLALRLWGVRAVFVTHMHELAENIEAMNAASPGESNFASLVAGINSVGEDSAAGKMAHRTYKITPAPPMGVSFAKDIARRHGISYEQLSEELRRRNQQ